MKKIAFLSLALAALSFTSCEQDSLDPLPTKVSGVYVTIDFEQVTLELDDIENTAFRATLKAPSNNVVSYELFISRRTPNGAVTTDPLLLKTITAFPHDLVVTPQDIADALGVDRSTLQAGDTYRFIGFSIDSSGKRIGYNDLSAILRTTESMKQGYRWSANAQAVINPEDPFNPYTPFTN